MRIREFAATSTEFVKRQKLTDWRTGKTNKNKQKQSFLCPEASNLRLQGSCGSASCALGYLTLDCKGVVDQTYSTQNYPYQELLMGSCLQYCMCCSECIRVDVWTCLVMLSELSLLCIS